MWLFLWVVSLIDICWELNTRTCTWVNLYPFTSLYSFHSLLVIHQEKQASTFDQLTLVIKFFGQLTFVIKKNFMISAFANFFLGLYCNLARQFCRYVWNYGFCWLLVDLNLWSFRGCTNLYKCHSIRCELRRIMLIPSFNMLVSVHSHANMHPKI